MADKDKKDKTALEPAGDQEQGEQMAAPGDKEPQKEQELDQTGGEKEPGGSEKGAVSDSLKAAMQAALESVEALEGGGEEAERETGEAEEEPVAEEQGKEKEEVPSPPSKRELELKMQIIDLQHRVRELEKEVENKIKEVRQNFDEGKRIQNQFEDYKVRMKREKADWFNYGHEPLIKEMLPVIDNLERALNHAVKSEGQGTAQEFESLREGIDLTWRQFLQLLEKFGVTRIEALGKPFDPNFHQAMGMLEDPDSPPNTVVEEHQPGYSLKDRLLRPCMVVVSCSPEGAPVEDNKSGPEESSGDEEDQKMQEDS